MEDTPAEIASRSERDLIEGRSLLSNGSSSDPYHRSCKATSYLALTALGVIFGDIGTSPLYVWTSTFLNDTPSQEDTLGLLSLIIWSLILIVSVKYITCILTADANGEGGTFALLSLLHRSETKNIMFSYLAIVGASFLLGDGIITPAISVLSALEGIAVFKPSLESAIVPLAFIILFCLFMVQRYGTGSIGSLFGPIMVLWFSCLGIIGLYNIVRFGRVVLLQAISPHYGLKLLASRRGFSVLGGVVLALTGTEALYADLGHFGRAPVRIAWFSLVFPALLLNYFGQGALLLENPSAVSNVFFHSVPTSAFWPILFLATTATVIASQSMITGAQSLVNQAVKLQLFPRVEAIHTSKQFRGQIYVPEVNYLLMFGVLAVILIFRRSTHLAGAYGVAVCFDMCVTSTFFIFVMLYVWRTKWWKILLYAVVFYPLDLIFLGSNLRKIPQGGWLPLVIAALFSAVMMVWSYGRQEITKYWREGSSDIVTEQLAKHSIARIPGTGLFFASGGSNFPSLFSQLVVRTRTMPALSILLHIRIVDVPYVQSDFPQRTVLELEDLGNGIWKAVATFGYATGKISAAVIARDVLYEMGQIKKSEEKTSPSGLPFKTNEEGPLTFFLGRDVLIAREGSSFLRSNILYFYNVLSRNSKNLAEFSEIPPEHLVEIGIRSVI